MRLRIFAGIVFLASFFGLFSQRVHADWAGYEGPGLVRLQPPNGALVKQNPPGFSWVRSPGSTSYEVSLRGPSDSLKNWSTQRNWFLPDSKLAPGTYFWKVRSRTPLGPWSQERSFSIDAAASTFLVPTDDQLLLALKARPSPRALGLPTDTLSIWVDRTRKDKASAISALEKEVKTYSAKPLIDEQSFGFVQRSLNENAWVGSISTIRQLSIAETRQLRAAALLWRLTGNHFYLDEAIRRGDALAELDWTGVTSHSSQDQGNRNIAWGLALAHDYLAADLPQETGDKWLASIKSRTTEIYKDLKSGNWRLEQTPFDSHGASNLGYLTAISSLMINRIPAAEEWFRNSFRAYVHYQSPWGDEEGGYGNGSAYAEYSAWAFIDFWDAIAASTGVSLYEKPWSKGLLRSLACFAPPGSPTHAFGDAAETKPDFSVIKAFSNRFSDAFSAWYGRNLIGNEAAFTALSSPFPTPLNQSWQAPVQNSCLFRHIGWAAMHSDWADRSRTSVFFKSSSYGSFNHSHADQNSFTVSAGGRPLLIDSGAYDWYGSPHWNNWYRQTVAHNAITFDGGKGQPTVGDSATLKAQGKIGRFESSANIDFVEGDATKAYGELLTKAVRKLWYIRSEKSIVIVDDLSSEIARKFEWNAHALAKFSQTGPITFKTQNMDQSACIDILSPTAVVSAISRVAVPVAEGSSASAPKETWHLSVGLPVAAPATRFIVVIRVGCTAQTSKLSGTKIIIGNATIESLK